MSRPKHAVAADRVDRWPSVGAGWNRVITLRPVARYLAAIGVAGAAILMRVALDPIWGTQLPFITFFPAIMLSAWLGGLWPGITTTLLCGAAAAYFWVAPARSWAIAENSGLLGVLVFVAVGVVISALNEAWRRGVAAVLGSEGHRRVTLASIGDAVLTTDSRGRVTRLNSHAEMLTGWTSREAIGRPLHDVFVIVNEGSRQPASSPVDRVLREGVLSGLANHTILISRDGRETPIDDSAAPIRNEEGELIGVVMVFRDISERRRMERELTVLLERERAAREETDRLRAGSEIAAEQLRVALEAGRLGTWEYTLTTGAVRWSPGLEAIHGYAPGEFPGTFDAFRNEIHPADRDRVLAAIRDAIDARSSHHVEYRIVRADGSVRWVEGRGELFLDDAQQPHRLVGVCSDVTERKLAEERFRLAVEAAPAAMLMIDRQGAIVLANALSEKLLGYSRTELVGRSIEDLVPPRFRPQHEKYRTAFFADSRQRPMGAGRDLYALHKDGSEVPVEIGLSPIDTADGVFVLAAVTDISERRQAESERAQLLAREQQARTELEKASRMKDEFLAVLSHELRTPLNAVVGYAHLLTSGALPPQRVDHAVRAIQRNAQAQARLVESLLDLSRIMAGKLELSLEPVELTRVIEAAVDVVRPDADAKGVTLDVAPLSSPVGITADAGRLQQVFWNLLSNAVKFTAQGGTVRVRCAEQDAHVRVEVTDTGCGIAAEFLPRVFDRFSQHGDARHTPRSGLGLGLALVREMVLAHGGTVTASSPGEGRGSSFVVTLPLSVDRVRPVPVRPGAHGASYQSIASIKILIVDDESDVRDVLMLMLESRGASVQRAASAKEALRIIDSTPPDLLLADLSMPDEDGLSLIRTIRAREADQGRGRLPAIAVSAYASPRDRDRALAAGYDSHVAKPVNPDDLLRAIARVKEPDAV